MARLQAGDERGLIFELFPSDPETEHPFAALHMSSYHLRSYDRWLGVSREIEAQEATPEDIDTTPLRCAAAKENP